MFSSDSLVYASSHTLGFKAGGQAGGFDLGVESGGGSWEAAARSRRLPSIVLAAGSLVAGGLEGERRWQGHGAPGGGGRQGDSLVDASMHRIMWFGAMIWYGAHV